MLDEHDQLVVIRGLRDGSREAWNRLYDGYSVDVWRYVASLVGHRATDVADLVQETFLAAAKSARRFDAQRGTLWNWLAAIAHNHVFLYWRQVQRGRRLPELAEAGAGELRRWLEEPCRSELLAEQHELLDFVRYVLANISTDYALLLTAKYLDELSLEEMALRFGGSPEAVKSKLARARREFRRKFEHLSRDPNKVICD